MSTAVSIPPPPTNTLGFSLKSTLASLPKRLNRLSFHEPPINIVFNNLTLTPHQNQDVERTFRSFCEQTLYESGLGFDAFKYSAAELIGIVLGMFYRQGIATRDIQMEKLFDFVAEVSRNYLDNPYHTWFHAVDVTVVVYTILTEFNVGEFFSRAEVAALLIAAVTHDVLHPGRNNLFQINIDAPVAKLYDGISVLENQSIDFTLDLLEKTELLRHLTLEEGDPRTLPHYSELIHPAPASETEESDSGLWLPHTTPAPLDSALTINRTADKLKKEATKRRRLLHRQHELEKLVLDILSSSVLYTDMKSHFLLTDQLEKLIEDVDDSTQTQSANAQYRQSLAIMPHADDANPVSPRFEQDIEFPPPVPAASSQSIPSGHSSEEEGMTSSKTSSLTMRTRRRSVIIPHADDANPIAINQDDIVLNAAPREPPVVIRRKSAAQVLMDPPLQPQGRRRPSVQFSDVEEKLPITIKPASLKSRASSLSKSEFDDDAIHFDQRKLLLNAILHAADISNVARPWPIAKTWSDLVVQEFFLQGDEEKKLGLAVSPNMDRGTSDQYQISIGFIEFLTKPFFEALAELLPAIQEMVDHMASNCERWRQMQAESKQADRSDRADRESTPILNVESAATIPEEPLTVESAIEFPSDVISPITSTLQTTRSSFSSTEPRRKRSSASSHLSPYDDRRLSTAAGVVDVPTDDWWEKHRTMRRISTSHGRGLAALESFTSFLDWKRLHSGSSTPNLLALNDEALPDGEDENDVLAAIHWYERDSPASPRPLNRRSTGMAALTSLTPAPEEAPEKAPEEPPEEGEAPKERRLSRSGWPPHLRGILHRSASVDTAHVMRSTQPWSPIKKK